MSLKMSLKKTITLVKDCLQKHQVLLAKNEVAHAML